MRSRPHIFNLPAELIVEVTGAEQDVVAEERLFDATLVGAILGRLILPMCKVWTVGAAPLVTRKL